MATYALKRIIFAFFPVAISRGSFTVCAGCGRLIDAGYEIGLSFLHKVGESVSGGPETRSLRTFATA